jgi:hypothetical protein
VSVTQTRAARAAAAAALAAYEFPALTFLSPALRRRLAIVDRIAGDRVALTFDDGPHHSRTPAVLGALARQASSGRLSLDRARIAAEERLDGKYLLTTSDPSLSSEDVALGYKQLLEAERSFRDLKGTLLLRPVFHRKDDRIRAHVLICFLALVLIRVAETRTGETWRTIRAELGQIRQSHFRSSDGEFTQTSELTARQRQLHASLAIPEPPHFGRISAAAAAPQP